MSTGGDLVVLGRLTGAWGVRGWVRIASSTHPPEAILDYREWWVGSGAEQAAMRPLEGRRHGGAVVARLDGIADRDAALALKGTEVSVPRAALPVLGRDEYYWDDLLGLEVVNGSGEVLGRVDGLMETGANDVLVVSGDRERLVPYVEGRVVLRVDLEARRIEVDWEADW